MAITAAVLGALVLAAIATANIWTEVVWYDQLGFTEVWRTQWIARVVLFSAAFTLAAVTIWLNLWIAKRVRPARTGGRSQLDQVREQIAPLERIAMIVLPAVIGLVVGLAVSSQWEVVLAWLNHEQFGVADPEFGLDAAFYVFTLPVLRLVVTLVLALAVLSTLISAFVHLLYGGITGSGRTFVASKGARLQLAILGAIVMLAIAANYWLDRYGLLTTSGDLFFGASYTDVNAILPSRSILAGIAIMVAIVFLAVIWRGDWRIPAVGIGLMILSAVAIGGIYPAIVQRFQVSPNEQEFEAPYIQRNIDATRFAYGIDQVETTPYRATTEASAEALREDAETTAQIRLLDPNVVSPAFQQLQQNRQYYNFADTLNVDRYDLGSGQLQDTVIAVRELNLDGLSDENRNWVNDHTVFTHGFGVVAAYGNRTTADGQPSFFEGGIPSVGQLDDYEPRIYFGTTLPEYSIVGAPEGTAPWELDFPDDDSPTGQVNTTYTGDGGPGIGSLLAKLLFAIRLGEEQLLFSERVTSESQILYYRDPIERVARVAPYLELDSTAYPAVVDGRVVWVVDGYTTTDQYPYSAPIQSSSIFAQRSAVPTGAVLNYVRNSVKATVDAYDGAVTLYAWDDQDPIIRTWQNIFPASIRPMTDISGELMSHLRYPEDLFAIQRFQLTTYHVTDAASYYSGQDFWRNPADPTADTRLQPPYYLTLQMPGQDDPTFSLTSNFIQGGNNPRNILTGYLAVNSETGSMEGQVSDDYGTLRLLELPRDTTIPGPGQVQNNFNSNSEAQTVLNLLRQGETDVINGNLLTLPVGGGLLYVQPVYVQSREGTRVPLLRKVFVAFGDEVGFADTLPQALDQVFGDGAGDGAAGGDGGTDGGTGGGTDSGAEAALQDALQRANQALQDSSAALAAGDFAAYGEAQDRLSEAIADAIAAEAELTGADGSDGDGSAEPSPAPSATPDEPAPEPEVTGDISAA